MYDLWSKDDGVVIESVVYEDNQLKFNTQLFDFATKTLTVDQASSSLNEYIVYDDGTIVINSPNNYPVSFNMMVQ